MPPGKYGMQEEWEKEGDQRIMMDFLLPTGIFLKFPVSRNDTIRIIKKVQPIPVYPVLLQKHLHSALRGAAVRWNSVLYTKFCYFCRRF